MRHLDSGRKLGRTTEHRWALFRNQVNSLVMKERIETTLPKAKELRPLAEWFVTLGRDRTIAAQRRAYDFSRSREVVQKLFSHLSPRFAGRPGGYTRIMKLGFRLGDAAPMAVIEFLPGEGGKPSLEEVKPAKAKKAHPKKPAKEKKAKLEAKSAKEKVAKPSGKKPKLEAKTGKATTLQKEEKRPEMKEKKSFWRFFRRRSKGE